MLQSKNLQNMEHMFIKSFFLIDNTLNGSVWFQVLGVGMLQSKNLQNMEHYVLCKLCHQLVCISFFLYHSWNLKLSLTIFQTLFTDVRMKFWWNNFGVSLLYLTVPKVFTQIVIWSPDTRSVQNTNNYMYM